MNNFQKAGGISALIDAGTFIVGLALYFTLLAPFLNITGDAQFYRYLAFLVENQTLMVAWNLIIYVGFGSCLVVLSLALLHRLSPGAPALAQTAAAFGIIWAGLVIGAGMITVVGLESLGAMLVRDPAQAATIWRAVDTVHTGLGGGIEIVGGMWVLLVSVAALRSGTLPRLLNYLGLVLGVAGLLTIIRSLEMMGAIFGLGLIVWFIWTGIVLLRRPVYEVARVETLQAATS
jgi:hypothetical protein